MSFDLLARLRLDDQLSGRLRRVSQGFNDVERRTRSARQGVRNFSSSVAKISSAIGVTAAVAGGFNMIRNSMGRAFQRIDTMENFSRVMNVMVGDTEKVNEALEATRDAVTGTAYTLDGAAATVQSFVTRGQDIDNAVGYVKNWGDAVAFYGDGSQEQFDNVSDALGKMLSTNKVTMDQMDRIIGAGIPAIDLYADKFGMTYNEVADALSQGTIDAQTFIDGLGVAMEEGGNKFKSIEGAAREAGSSWQSVFSNMMTHIATGVEEMIKTIDGVLEESGLPSMRDMVAKVGETIRDSIKKAAEYIPIFQEHLKSLKPHWPIIKEGLIGAAIALGALGAAFTAVSIASSMAMITNPIGLTILAIGALIAIGVIVVRNWEKIKEVGANVWDSVKTFISNAMDRGKTAVANFFQPLFDFIDRAVGRWNDFKNALSNFKMPKIGLPKMLGGGGLIQTSGSHYHGLDRVPRDGYIARLHRGERVLNRQEADIYDRFGFDDLMGGGDTYNQTYNNSTTNNAGSGGRGSAGGINIAKLADQIVVREEADIDKVTYQLAHKIKAAMEAGA